jgi:hypothetical protein
MQARQWVLMAVAVLALFTASPVLADSFCGNRFDIGKGNRLRVFGLTADQRLVRFWECLPGHPRTIGAVYGLQTPDTALVGIDFRVQDGKLYGVGNGGGIYTIDTYTAQATLVSQLAAGVSLEGTFFGVDFNPAADRLRIVSNTGQNLRHNVNAGGTTLVDQRLNYPPATPVCQALAAGQFPAGLYCQQGPTAQGITGAAYTNNDLDTTSGTTLFDIDAMLNQVSIQSPPNNGALAATGQLTVDPDSPVGFDIYTDLRKGKALNNRGFASLVVNGQSGFYRINVLTGQAFLIGYFDEMVIDIAIPLQQG